MRWTTILLLAGLLVGGSVGAGEIADEIFESLQSARAEAGTPALVRRADLDGVAEARATHVAGLPHEKRMIREKSIERLLSESGIRRIHRASVHQDMQRGFTDPAAAFMRVWGRYETPWNNALGPDFDHVGIATARGDDGWLVLTVVLIDQQEIPGNLREVARQVTEAINKVRLEHGLEALTHDDALADVARAHSEDMAERDYFAHRSPERELAEDRVRVLGIRYRMLAENLYRSRGTKDPVRSAVEGWMRSKGHRKNILTPEFERTGVGVALDARDRIYFTQLFSRPPAGP